jgi:TfoX/Sxy family transcriptional regulator of competence genes
VRAVARPKRKMKWRSSPPELVRVFAETTQAFPQVQVRKMFGYPAAFVNGNMAAGLFQDSMMLRLSATDRAAIRAQPFEPMPGRAMREYIVVPDAILKSKSQLKAWFGKAVAYTSSLPAKPTKRRKSG